MEDTLFRAVFGDSPTIKVLEWFLTCRGLDYTITDVASSQHIGRAITYEVFDRLTKKGIIKKTRQIGAAKLYALNMESTIVIDLIKVFDNIISVHPLDGSKD